MFTKWDWCDLHIRITNNLYCPILIGDILQRINDKNLHSELCDKFLLLWWQCWYNKSLQEIIDKSGWCSYIVETTNMETKETIRAEEKIMLRDSKAWLLLKTMKDVFIN